MSEIFNKWVENVKIELIKQNLNQTKLAYGIGVSKTLISDLFNYGKGSKDLKQKINKFLNIDINFE